jgi:hypothetical protein
VNEPDFIQGLIDQLQKQKEKGLKKYGVTVVPDTEDAEYWLQHLLEEQADSYIYGHALLTQIQKMNVRLRELEDELATTRESLRITETDLRLLKLEQVCKEDQEKLQRVLEKKRAARLVHKEEAD